MVMTLAVAVALQFIRTAHSFGLSYIYLVLSHLAGAGVGSAKRLDT